MRDSLERSGAKTKDPVQLQKRLGLFSGVALIVGTMIGEFNRPNLLFFFFLIKYSLSCSHYQGSGIFVSPSGLLVRTGSVGISFLIWLACGLLSLLGECHVQRGKMRQK